MYFLFIYEKITAVGYFSYTFLFVHISEKNFEKNLWSFEKVSKNLWSFPNFSGNVSQKNGAGKQKYANKKLSIKLISSFIAVLAREYLMDF